MDILQKKTFIPELQHIISYLKFKSSKIKLMGSASLQSQLYSSDFDLSSQIKRKYKPVTIFHEFLKILDNSMKFEDVYFIEFKIQSFDKKIKYNDISQLRPMDFKNFDFVKIDYIIRIDNIFKELTIIYNFNHNNNGDIISNIKEDIIELVDSGQYYKALKRLFSIHKINKNKKKLLSLTRFFNGPSGKLYKINSNLKAIQTLLNIYHDPVTLRKVNINLKDIGIKPNDNIDELISNNDDTLNEIAQKIYHVNV